MSELKKLFEKMYIQNAPSWSVEQDDDGSYKYHATKSAFTLFEIQQAKIDDNEAALKEALAWVEDLKRERAFLQKKCAERADRIDAALHYAENRKLGNGISGDDSSDLDYIIRALHGDFES